MKQSRKDFIIKAHKHACSDWKGYIEEEFPKLFKSELEIGKWYKYTDVENWKLCITVFNGTDVKGYGFSCSRLFMEDWRATGCNELDTLIPCTDEEVETALIKEAKKRGFEKGSTIIDARDFKKEKISEIEFEICNYKPYGLELTVSKGKHNYCVLFSQGKWATIIETITKEDAEKQLGKTIIN